MIVGQGGQPFNTTQNEIYSESYEDQFEMLDAGKIK